MKAMPWPRLLVTFTAILAIAVCQAVHGQEEKGAQRLLRTFKGHSDEVTDVAFSPDGKQLATASRDRTARIWYAATGKELHALKGHDNFVDSVAFSPDGKWIATGGWDAAVRLWDPATGKEVRSFQAGDPGSDSVHSVAFGPDSKKLIAVGMLVVAGDNEPILIWDVATGTREHKLDGQVTNGLFSVTYTRDGKLFATSGYVGGIRIWDAATGRLVRPLHWDSDEQFAVSQVVFSRDGKLLASAGDDRMIRLWDVATGREVRKLEGHAGTQGKGIERGQIVTSVAFSPDGKLLASAGANEGTVRLWDVAAGREVRTIKAHTGTVQRVVFHPDGDQLATGGADGTVKLWDVSAVRAGQKGSEK
jgi:WD40 repeat protein